MKVVMLFFFFFSSRRRHTRSDRDWSSDVCSSDLLGKFPSPISRSALVRCAGPIFLAKGEDRKSTRLNSSHDQISYAVLCLKKKKRRVPGRWPALGLDREHPRGERSAAD